MEFAVYTISVKGFFSKEYEIHQNDMLAYKVKKPSFFATSQMIFYDADGYEILKVKKHFTVFTFKFSFLQNDEEIATFDKKGIENYYDSDGIFGRHTVQGDFFSREYTVYDDDGEIAKISRKQFRSNKKYGVAIIKGHDELYILAMVIAISMVNARSKKKA